MFTLNISLVHVNHLKEILFISFLMAFGELLLRKSDVEDRRSKAQKESKLLLDNTRKAIARLSHLKRSINAHIMSNYAIFDRCYIGH